MVAIKLRKRIVCSMLSHYNGMPRAICCEERA
jgi:hypothetical protein